MGSDQIRSDFQDVRYQNQWVLRAASRKKVTESSAQETADEEGAVHKTDASAKQPVKRGRKKSVEPMTSDVDIEGTDVHLPMPLWQSTKETKELIHGAWNLADIVEVTALLRMLTVQPDLITDKAYLEHSIKYAIDCGVIDQWSQARIRGFPADEDSEKEEEENDEVEPDPDRIRSVTETEFFTADDPGEREVPYPALVGITLLSQKIKEPEQDLEPVS